MVVQEHNILNLVDEILQYTHNESQKGMKKREFLDFNIFYNTKETQYLYNIIQNLFPCNIGVYVPDILIPVNLKYNQDKTEILALQLLNNNSFLFS